MERGATTKESIQINVLVVEWWVIMLVRVEAMKTQHHISMMKVMEIMQLGGERYNVCYIYIFNFGIPPIGGIRNFLIMISVVPKLVLLNLSKC